MRQSYDEYLDYKAMEDEEDRELSEEDMIKYIDKRKLIDFLVFNAESYLLQLDKSDILCIAQESNYMLDDGLCIDNPLYSKLDSVEAIYNEVVKW